MLFAIECLVVGSIFAEVNEGMSGLSVTINQIAPNADRAFAYALLAKLAKGYVMCAYRLRVATTSLDDLLTTLTHDNVELLIKAVTSEPVVKIKARLEDIHRALAECSRSEEFEALSRLPVLGSLIGELRNKSEDLGDIVDSLALASNPDFKSLLSCCASTLGLTEGPEESVGGKHS